MNRPELKDTAFLNALAVRVHILNQKWWLDIRTGEPIMRDPDELLMLIVSELSEALEGHRKNLMDDKLPHRKMIEVEMADAYIRIADFAGGFNLPIVQWELPSSAPSRVPAALFWLTETVVSLGSVIAGMGLIPRIGFYIGHLMAEIECFCHQFDLDLFGAIEEKLEYNRMRMDHSHEHRLSENGKKY